MPTNLRRLAGRTRDLLGAQPASAWTVLALATIAYITLAATQWGRYQSPSWDLGIFTQIIQQYAGFNPPIVHIKGADYNILGDHFHPILVLLAPVYALFPSAFTLMACQALLLGISAFFVAKAADLLLGRVGGWLIGLAYAFCWGVQQAAVVQFHEVAMGAPILAIGLWLLVRQNPIAATIWFSLLVFVKEDLGLTVLMLGVVLGLRTKQWLLGALLSAWGLLWFVLAMFVILPALNPRGQYDYADNVSLSDVLTDPIGTLAEILTNEQKMATVLLLLACTGFLCLRSHLALALLPTLGWRFLSGNEGHWGQTWHYSLMLMPIAYVAAADGIAKLQDSRFAFFRGYARHGAAVVLTFAVAISNQLPLWELTKPQTWEFDTPRQHAAAALIERVPEGAVVESDSSLMNHLVDDHDVYFIGQQGNPAPDYLVVDNLNGGWNTRVNGAEYGAQIHPGTRWEIVYDEENYQLTRRIG